MPETAQNSRILRFGTYEVDLRAGELRKSGLRIKLQEQPFQLLSMLLEQPGEVVTREELQKRLWPGDTFVDFEHGLNTAITKLRQALGDEADNPRFIETLPKRGYRFIGQVAASGNGSPATAAPAPGAESFPSEKERKREVASRAPARKSLLARPIAWVAGLAVLGALALPAWFASLRTARPRWSEVRIAPLNGLPREQDAAFSPDGSRVAFVWAGEKNDNVDIYITQIGNEVPQRLTNSPAVDISPVWSPDGRYIAFVRFSRDGQSDGIYIASVLGGSERRVYPQAALLTKELDWSPDGRYLAFAERKSPSEASSIFLLSLDNLEKHQLTFPPSGILGDFGPAFSPDGKSVGFLRDSLDTDEIHIVPVSGGTPRQVTFDNRIINGISWSADGREIIYSSTRAGGPFSLWRIPPKGGTPERLPIGGGAWAMRPTVARQGNRMAYTNVTYSSAIWRTELPEKGNAPGPGEKFISSTQLEEGPQISPDGKRIVFQSTRTGTYEIWRCDRDGSNLVQLTHFGGPLTGTPRWSPDGSWIVFDSRREGHSQIFVVNAEGGQPRQVTSGTNEHAVPSWSRDGQWIYYASNEGGSWQVWGIPVQGGAGKQMTRQGGFAALASTDGKFLYYAKGRNLPGIWRVPVEGGEEVKVLDGPPGGFWGYFAVGEKGVYYADAPGHKDPGIYLYDFAARTSTKVIPLPSDKGPSEGAPALSVSPDGRSFLYVLLDQPSVYIVLVENFR